MTTRDDCLRWDAENPLAFARERFRLPGGVIYLDGNSLGALPRATPARMAQAVEHEWGERLIASWNEAGWIDLPAKLGGAIARLIGAGADEVVVADSTSVNLFKAAAAALHATGRRVILHEAGDFPTDSYVLEGLARVAGAELRLVDRDRVAEALTDDVGVLVLTHVHYRSGAVHDMAGVNAAAQAAGAQVVWDLSHSAGALDVRLNDSGAEYAVGCGYKYLNGGPGAPAFLYVARGRQADFANPLSGWMGHAAPFAFQQGYAPAAGVLRGLCGTPPVLSMTALEQGLATFEGVDMAALRAKSMRLTSLFLDLVAERCAGFGLETACPPGAAVRGSQVSLRHPHGYEIVQALIAEGVVGDFRAPDVLRFGFAPLYVSCTDVFDAVETLRRVMAEERWRDTRFSVRLPVT